MQIESNDSLTGQATLVFEDSSGMNCLRAGLRDAQLHCRAHPLTAMLWLFLGWASAHTPDQPWRWSDGQCDGPRGDARVCFGASTCQG